MRLESAVFSTREGLISHGQAIAVVGDNVSNASTVGYKTQRVEFADLVPGGEQGGSLPSTGSGSSVARVRSIQETGVIEPTGRAFDVGIAGKGFFMVGDPDNQRFTRAGNFEIGADGLLKTADGDNVLGYTGETGTDLGTIDTRNLNVVAQPTTSTQVFGNIDSKSEVFPIPDEIASFRDIAESAAFVTSIDVFDSYGESHDISIAFYKTAANTYDARAYIDGGDVGQEAGVPVQVGNATTLTFAADGTLTSAAGTTSITASPQYSNGATAGNFVIDLDGFTQYSGPNQVSSFIRDGRSTGTISEYEFREDGSLIAKLDTGLDIVVARLPLANFSNPDGLERIGQNLFIATDKVGEQTVFVPSSTGVAELQPAALERSTVDVASQFFDLVLYQRGYQASSQTLNAASAMLRDTIGLIR